MANIQDLYDALSAAKCFKDKYRCSLRIVGYFCDKGDVINAGSTLNVLSIDYASKAGVTKDRVYADSEAMFRRGYVNAIPREFEEIEKCLVSEGPKNFGYLECKLEGIVGYALKSKSLNANELVQLKKKVERLRLRVYDIKEKAPIEEVSDWEVATLEEAAEGIGHYSKGGM